MSIKNPKVLEPNTSLASVKIVLSNMLPKVSVPKSLSPYLSRSTFALVFSFTVSITLPRVFSPILSLSTSNIFPPNISARVIVSSPPKPYSSSVNFTPTASINILTVFLSPFLTRVSKSFGNTNLTVTAAAPPTPAIMPIVTQVRSSAVIPNTLRTSSKPLSLTASFTMPRAEPSTKLPTLKPLSLPSL